MRRILSLVAFFATLQASAQQVNPVPDYVFRNQMSVGRNAVTDTGAYFSIGPRYGAVKGFMPPIVSDTASVNANKRNGLLIFSVQKNKFLYWDSVRVQWSDMAGSSGSYITGKGITGYVPQYTDTATLDTSALYTLGNQLGIGTSSFAYTGSGRTVVELNGTAGGLYGFKRNDSAKGYLFHNGDNMELANTMAGSISFNTNSATRGSIASDGVWRLNNLAGTGDRVVQASSNGTLSATASVTGLVDTLTISTRAWRQKGIDSVASLSRVGGSGTTNTIAKFSASTTIANSLLTDNAVELKYTGADGATVQGTTSAFLSLYGTGDNYIQFKDAAGTAGRIQYNHTSDYMSFNTASTERLRIFANGRVFVGASPTDAGYQLDINGTLRSVNGANFATTSGNVGVGTATPALRLHSNSTGAASPATSGTSQTGALRLSNNFSATVLDFGFDISNNAWMQVVNKDDLSIEYPLLINQNGGDVIVGTATDAGTYAFQVAGNIYNTGSAVLAATSGEVLIGTTTDRGAYKLQADGLSFFGSDANSYTLLNNTASNAAMQAYGAWTNHLRMTYPAVVDFDFQVTASGELDLKRSSTVATRVNTAREFMINTTTDAGDYHLQVVGNARIGTGKLDIASNTTFGLGVARSGTSEVAGQIYNSNGILYLGAESSAGGAIFTGSSAYAAVIGSGANYPLQFATNNATRATINTNGELLINTLTDNGDFKLQVNGNALVSGSIKTANGGSSTAQPWHLGSVVATSVQLDTNNYVEVEINGVYYRLAIVTPL